VDSVDFFFVATDGFVANSDAQYMMWDENSFACTSSMRLGDSGEKVKVFASFTCFTFQNSDGLFWQRWKDPFAPRSLSY